MKTHFTRNLILLCSFACLFSLKSFAQLNYQTGGFSTAASTYTDLGTNGTVVTMTDIDAGHSAPLDIGFTFRFNGTNYDSLVMYVDGFVKLGRDTASGPLLFTTFVQPPAGGPFNSTNPLDTNLIVPFGQDLWDRGGLQASEFRIFTTGTVGSRVCTIQWKNVSDKLQNAVTSQYDTINFQLKLYETTNWIEFVYGRWVASTNTSNARFAACGLKGNSTLANQLLTVTKGSTVSWQLPTINAGNYINNAVNYGNNVSVARPAPDAGRIYRFTPVVFNDVAVSAVYSMGKVAMSAYIPDSIRAYITNPGVNAQTNVTVTLTVSGANSYTTTATIANINSGGNAVVAFAPFTPTSYGNTLITVSVPLDDNVANNSKDYGMSVSERHFAYTDTLIPAGQAWGSVAFTFWGCRYRISGTRMITTVRSFLFSNADAVGDTICAMILDTAGNVLGRSPSYVVQPADQGTWLTFNITTPPVLSNRAFIAGVANGVQTSNLFLGSVQNEVPLRTSPDFFQITNSTGNNITNLTPGSFFGTPINTTLGRLLMECTADPLPPNDASISAAFPVNNLTVPTGVNIPLRAVLKNMGTATQSAGIPIRYRVNNGTIVGPVNTTASVNQDDTTSVSFSGASSLNFATAGTYTIKIWSALTGDALSYNDTLTLTLNAVSSGLNLPYRLSSNITGNWMLHKNPNNLIKQGTFNNPNGASIANTMYFDNFTIAGEGLIYSPLLNLTGSTNPVMHFHVAHAPSTFAVSDSLQVMVSTNGGFSFTTLYTKTGQGSTPPLGTVAAQGTLYSPAGANDWRQEFIDLSSYANAGQVMIAFRMVSATGNRVFISNINITNPALVSSTTIGSSGTYANGNLSVTLNAAGATNGVLSMSNYIGVPVSAATPVFATNASATTNNSAVFTPSNVGTRMWNVNYSGIGTGNLPSTVSYQVIIDLTGIPGISNTDSLYLMRRSEHNGSWVAVSSSIIGNSLMSAIITGFSEFALGSVSTANALPVSFMGVKATRKQNDVEVTWQTASEVNNAGFEIERINNNKTEVVGMAKGAGTSVVVNHYLFTDYNQTAQAYYRIKQIDFDGNYSYSPLAFVDGLENKVEITPNPFVNNVSINLKNLNAQKITVYDMQGKVLYSTEVSADSSELVLTDLNNLSNGLYYISVQTDTETITRRLIKSN